jgi:hypothetical protein
MYRLPASDGIPVNVCPLDDVVEPLAQLFQVMLWRA